MSEPDVRTFFESKESIREQDRDRFEELKKQSHAIFDKAVEEYEPLKSFVLYSGGKDSYATALTLQDHPAFEGVLHIDTGTGIPETRKFVEKTAEKHGWPLHIVEAPRDEYERMVTDFGFPSPPTHRYAYIRLKEKPLSRFLTPLKSKPQAKEYFLLLTGVRRLESHRRMGHVSEIQKMGSKVWVAPLIGYNGFDVRNVLRQHGVEENPVSAILGFSGECLCGAYAKNQERGALQKFFPKVWKRIQELEEKAEKVGVPCRWAEYRDPSEEEREVETMDVNEAFMPMCEGCELPDHDHE